MFLDNISAKFDGIEIAVQAHKHMLELKKFLEKESTHDLFDITWQDLKDRLERLNKFVEFLDMVAEKTYINVDFKSYLELFEPIEINIETKKVDIDCGGITMHVGSKKTTNVDILDDPYTHVKKLTQIVNDNLPKTVKRGRPSGKS
ncbi:MAG TPA: hypothetical protein VKR58_05750 [Aquella sp.]|nr:hypothetical protein [Aquella sp.]